MATQQRKPPAKPVTGPGSDDSFTYSTPDGDITIPSMARMPAGLIRRIRKLSVGDQAFTVLEEYADPDTLALVDKLTAVEFNEFYREWIAHSGITPGE